MLFEESECNLWSSLFFTNSLLSITINYPLLIINVGFIQHSMKSRGSMNMKGKMSNGEGSVGEEEEEEEYRDERKKKLLISGGGGSSQPCCQVENCCADLTNVKQYHRRHKVCEVHAKAPIVAVAGLWQRFCQQCSRFHEISAFDEAKRSCRRRLAGHNERRRKNTFDNQGEGSG